MNHFTLSKKTTKMGTFIYHTRSKGWQALLLLLVGLFLFPATLSASHIVGGDINYRCLGNNQYEVILNVYRDCLNAAPGADFDDPAKVGIFRIGEDDPITVLQMEFDPMVDDTISNNLMDPCLIITDDVCVHTTTYREIVTLDFEPEGYVFVYQRCCRNEIIQNIEAPESSGMTLSIRLTALGQQECNSSPDFGAIAPIYICNQKPLIYDHSATDPDGDQLVYRLCTPVEGASLLVPEPNVPDGPPFDSVQWVEPFYDQNNMLGGTIQPLQINANTGELTAFPEFIGTFVVGICVDEYRNGNLLSSTRRDFQYTVQECGEVISSFFAPEAQCENLTVEFENLSEFSSSYRWFFDWPNLSPNTQQPNPTFTYQDTGLYTVALIAQPNSVCADTFFRQIYLQDNSLFPDFEIDIFDCTNTSVVSVTDMSIDTISDVEEWLWELGYGNTSLTSTEQNPIFEIPNPVNNATLILTVKSINGCIRTYSENFQTGLDTDGQFFEDEFNICAGESVELNPNFQQLGNYPYFWFPNDEIPDPTIPNPIVSPEATTIYTAEIYGPDSICSISREAVVNVFPVASMDFDYEVGCDGLTVKFFNQSEGADTYFWDFGVSPDNSDTSTEEVPTFTFPTYGTYTITLASGDGTFCPDTIQRTIEIEEAILQADFTYEISDCETDGVTVQLSNTSINSLNNTETVFWQVQGYGNFTNVDPVFTVTENTTIVAKLIISTTDGCQDAMTQSFDVQLIDISIQDEILRCPGENVFLNPGGNPTYTYAWSPSTGLSANNIPNPMAAPSQTTTYTATITQFTFDACTVTREVTVVVPPAINADADQVITTCDSLQELTASADVAVDYSWESSNNGTFPNTPTIEVLVSGITEYTVTMTDAFNCTDKTNFIVQGGPVQIAATDQEVACSNEPILVSVTNLDPNDSLTYDWNPDNAIITGANTPVPIVSNTPGTTVLTVTATSLFGCEATDTSTVVVFDDDIELDFSYELACDGKTVQFINESLNAFDYLWIFGDGTTSTEVNPVHEFADFDDYSVTLTVIYEGVTCVEDAVRTVTTIPPEVKADFSFEYSDCENEQVVISFFDQSTNSFNNPISYQWTFTNGFSSNEQNPIMVVEQSMNMVGRLIIETANGCRDTVLQPLQVGITEVDIEEDITLCFGDTTALNPTGNNNYEYLWTPSTGLSDPTVANPLAFPTETTTYSVEIRNFSADTCTLFRQVTVFVTPEITIDLSVNPDEISCNVPVTIEASVAPAGLDIIWTDGNGFMSTNNPIVVNPQDTTTYTVTVTDQFQCSQSDSARILVDQRLELDLSLEGEVTSCNEPVTIAATVDNGNPEMIVWSNGESGVFEITVDPDPNTTTVYTVTIEDELGCETTDSVEIFFPEVVLVNTPNNLISCNAQIGIPSNTNVPVDYNWTNANGETVGQNATLLITPTETGYYYLEVTDQYGCTAQDSSLVQVPPAIFLQTTEDFISCNSSVDLSVTSNLDPDLTYTWFNTAGQQVGQGSTISQNPTVTTVYTVVAEDAFGCQASDAIQVTVPPAAINIQLEDTTFCQGPVLLEANSNYLNAQFTWVDETGAVVNIGPTFEVYPEFQAYYIVTALNAFDCSIQDTIFVTNGEVDMGVTSPQVLCPTDSVPVFAQNLDLNDTLNFSWTSSPNGVILTDPLQDTIGIQPPIGTSFYYVEAINQFDCQSTDTIEVTVQEFLPDSSFVMDICPGVPTLINPDGNPGYVYNWIPDTGLDDASSPNPVATVFEDITYTVEITNFGNVDTCSAQFQVTLNVSPDINIEAFGDTTLCDPGDLVVSATSDTPVDFAWSEEPDFSTIFSTDPNPTVTPEGTVIYYVTATDALGCKDTAQVQINSYPIDIDLQPRYDLCLGAELDLEVINNASDQILTYQWQPVSAIITGASSSIATVSPAGSTAYSVTVTNQFNCMDSAATFVNVVDVGTNLFAFADPDTIILNSGQFSQLTTNDSTNFTYIWEPADFLNDPSIFNPEARPEETTEYTVTIVGDAGCTGSRTVTVVVINPDCIEPYVFIPSGFTPNNDGVNDVVFVRGNNIDELYFTIYNRWGQKLFETEDPNVGWDGTFKGEVLAPDVYGYYVRLRCYNGEEYFKKGNITLIR